MYIQRMNIMPQQKSNQMCTLFISDDYANTAVCETWSHAKI